MSFTDFNLKIKISTRLISKRQLYHNADLKRGKTISFMIIEWSSFVKPLVRFSQRCFVPSLVETDPVVLERKVEKCAMSTDRQIDRRTDRRWTIGDQKSSPELSAEKVTNSQN